MSLLSRCRSSISKPAWLNSHTNTLDSFQWGELTPQKIHTGAVCVSEYVSQGASGTATAVWNFSSSHNAHLQCCLTVTVHFFFIDQTYLAMLSSLPRKFTNILKSWRYRQIDSNSVSPPTDLMPLAHSGVVVKEGTFSFRENAFSFFKNNMQHIIDIILMGFSLDWLGAAFSTDLCFSGINIVPVFRWQKPLWQSVGYRSIPLSHLSKTSAANVFFN